MLIYDTAEHALRARAVAALEVFEQKVWMLEAKLRTSQSEPNLLRQLEGIRLNVARARSFVPKIGDDLQCFICWMEDERQAPLYPIPEGGGRYHSYRCKHCGRDWEWQFR